MNRLQNRPAAAVEAMEPRIMLLATPMPAGNLLTLSAKGTLLVDATGAHFILVARDKDHASKFYFGTDLSGQKFPAQEVKRIEVLGDDRWNRVTIDDSRGLIGVPITIFGQGGNDTLVGDLSPATFDGGAGDDSVIGSSQGDVILGGAGNDTLLGGGGNDQIFGGAGNDAIYGSAGNDYLFGNEGNDTLDGQTLIDSIFGDAVMR